LSKVAGTYWNNSRKTKAASGGARKNGRPAPQTPNWYALAIVVSLGLMLCLAINLRAVSEMTEGAAQNAELNGEIEKLSAENLSLQEEIHDLKSDSEAIEREARKIGMSRPNEKILVPAN
jgi:cell division protein FtsB